MLQQGTALLVVGGGGDEARLANPISSEMSHLRPDLIPGLLQAAARNQARGAADLGLFEIGRVFSGGEPGDEATQAAGLRSGARSTAKNARELGRHVMAVPGPVESSMSAGCHAEIRMGATLVTDAAEVIELVGRIGLDLAPVKQGAVREEDGLDERLRRIWQWLRPRRSSSVDEVMVRSGLTLGEVLAGLGELEELGRAEHLLDGWRRRPAP